MLIIHFVYQLGQAEKDAQVLGELLDAFAAWLAHSAIDPAPYSHLEAQRP